MSRPFVSVVTPTYNRRAFLQTAIACYKAQTYPADRMEWIVLDDGTDKVGDVFAAAKIKNLRYIPVEDKMPIGAKRNRLNKEAKGDIVVCWDDDDYYPPDRVRDAVTKLEFGRSRKVEVVGSSQLYMYFTDINEIWTLGPFNSNHATNGTMAYWRTYAKDHKYDDTATKAEERVFMDEWKTPVIQLPAKDVMLVLCHSDNTFDKRPLRNQATCKRTALKLNQFIKDKKIRDFWMSLKPTPVIPHLVVSEVLDSQQSVGSPPHTEEHSPPQPQAPPSEEPPTAGSEDQQQPPPDSHTESSQSETPLAEPSADATS